MMGVSHPRLLVQFPLRLLLLVDTYILKLVIDHMLLRFGAKDLKSMAIVLLNNLRKAAGSTLEACIVG